MYQRILIAVDGSEPSLRALEEALGLAKDQGARLRIISVLDLTPLYMGNMYLPNLDDVLRSMHDAGETILGQARERAQHAGVDVETVLRESDGERVSQVIIDEAEQSHADLVIVGTHGRHGIGHLLLGSVAEGVARTAPVPVLLVRATGS